MEFLDPQYPLREGVMRALTAFFLGLGLLFAAPQLSLEAQQLAQAYTSTSVARANSGDTTPLDRRVNLEFADVSLQAGLRLIRDHAGVRIAFSPSLLPTDIRVSCDCQGNTVREALEATLLGTGFGFDWRSGQILIERDLDVGSARSAASRFSPLNEVESALRKRTATTLEPTIVPLRTTRTGSITGTVMDSRSLSPLMGVQVTIQSLQISVSTGRDGRFTMTSVPAGTHTIEARFIGRASQSHSVTVRSGESVSIDFHLADQPMALDGIVVTGTAGQARRREIGNTISQINTEQIAEPIQNVDNLLQGRIPGLSLTRGSGASGSGGQIRLRGNVSVAMSNQPLVYIDGVRIRSDGYPRNVSPAGHQGRSNNDIASPLNDINPEDIERVEVIKGAAATTLYGTEAAAGVIQIFTKRGAAGAAMWTARIDQGFAKTRPFAPKPAEYLFLDPWLRTAHMQTYSLSVNGGSDQLRYFASVAFDDNEGVLPNDWERKYLIRGNFGFSPSDRLNIQWNTSYTKNTLSNTPAGNNAHGLMLNAFRGDGNFFGDGSVETISQVLDYEIFNYIDRFVTGVTTTYSASERQSHRLTVGYDLAMSEMRQLRPFGFALAPEGILSDIRWSNATLTGDYVGSLDYSLPRGLGARFSWGGQAVRTEEIQLAGYAEDFPGPGIPTVSSGALTQAFEDRIEVINAGFFLQNMFSLDDRYFVTVGLRVDGNSAFGSNFGLQYYPKISGTYVISDADFWGERWGEMKLRAAYGQSGRAPGAFDAVRTWNPQGWGGQPAFGPGNVGNADLGPERTAETEFGFDWSGFDGRVSMDVTRYQQNTTDALFSVRQVPSLGFGSSQLENVGKIQNRGVELALTGIPIERQDWGLELGLTVSTNHSKVVDLGGAPPFSLGSNGWIVEGQPVPVLRGRRITNPNEVADFEEELEHFYGPNQPTLIVGPRFSLRFPMGITFSGRGEYQGGHYMYEAGSFNALVRGIAWPTCRNAHALLDAGQGDQLTATERARCITANVRQDWFIYPVDFFKIRDLTVSAPVGSFVPRAHQATLTLSLRDPWTWKNSDFPIMDPEVGGNTGMHAQVRQIGEHVPPPAVFTASIRVTF
jgi:TonB-dependent starch-binding outer membrane protein SusC